MFMHIQHVAAKSMCSVKRVNGYKNILPEKAISRKLETENKTLKKQLNK